MLARYSGCLLILALVTWSHRVRAGNDDELFVGNQAAMLAGAISSTVSDSSSIWYNPAGLGQIERDQVDVSATVYTLRLYDSPGFIESTTGESDDGAVTEFVVAPTQIAYVRRLGPGFSLGLGYFVPRASNYVLREMLEAGRSASRQSWQVAASIAEVQHIGSAAIGYAVSPRIRVGVGLYGGYGTSTNSVNLFGSVLNLREPGAAVTTTAIGTESRLTMELGFGVQIDLTERLVLGINARSPQLQLHANSDAIQNVVIASVRLEDGPVLATESSHDKQSQGLDLRKAGRAGLALAYVFGAGRVSFEVDIQPGLERREIDVNRKTQVNARAGFYHELGSVFAVGFGLFTDRSAEAVAWEFAGGSGDFYGGTIGLEITNEHLLAPGERVSSLQFNSVFALRYAYSNSDFGRVLGDPGLLEQGPFLESKGSLIVHEVGLYVGSGLRF